MIIEPVFASISIKEDATGEKYVCLCNLMASQGMRKDNFR